MSCFDQQRGRAGRLCDPRASASRLYSFRFTLLEARCLVKHPSSPAGERGLVEREAPEGESMWREQKAQHPRPPVVFPATSAHMLYICVRLSWRFQPPPSSQLGAHVTSADASRSRRTGHLSSAWIPDPQNHRQ